MPRWEPNPRERLERAAITLFAEQGYDATTVDEIAASAGLARSAFFRHFRDKRGVLFGGEDPMPARLADGVRNAPPEQTALQAVETAFAGIADVWFSAESRDLAPLRFSVIAASDELRERELLKRHGITEEVRKALGERGIGDPAATVAASLATLAFARTVAVWGRPGETEEFTAILSRVLGELHAAARELP